MQAATIALLGVGGYLLYKNVKAVQSATTLNFFPNTVKNLTFDGLTPVITVGIAVQNPSNQSYLMKSVVGNVFANGYLIGNVSSFSQVTIQPTAQTTYWIQVRLQLIGIVQDIVNAFNGNGVAQTIELQANVNVNNFLIPLKIQYHIP